MRSPSQQASFSSAGDLLLPLPIGGLDIAQVFQMRFLQGRRLLDGHVGTELGEPAVGRWALHHRRVHAGGTVGVGDARVARTEAARHCACGAILDVQSCDNGLPCEHVLVLGDAELGLLVVPGYQVVGVARVHQLRRRLRIGGAVVPYGFAASATAFDG